MLHLLLNALRVIRLLILIVQLNGKGDALLKLGKYDEAIAIYDKVQSLPVDDIGAWGWGS